MLFPRITLSVLTLCFSLTLSAAGTVKVVVEADKPGATISRQIYGQFAEHLGRGIYEGIWVGKDSPIANYDGFRSDVIDALGKLRIPNIRWPGGPLESRFLGCR